MNIKLIFGVAIPLLIVVVMIFTAGLEIGFSVEETVIEEIEYKDIFKTDYLEEFTKVMDIRLVNDFDLAKVHQLPKMTACLFDNDGVKESVNLKSRYMGVPQKGYSENAEAEPITVEKGHDVSVSLMVALHRSVTVSPYDEILLVKELDGFYNSCSGLSERDFENAIRIPIVNYPTQAEIDAELAPAQPAPYVPPKVVQQDTETPLWYYGIYVDGNDNLITLRGFDRKYDGKKAFFYRAEIFINDSFKPYLSDEDYRVIEESRSYGTLDYEDVFSKTDWGFQNKAQLAFDADEDLYLATDWDLFAKKGEMGLVYKSSEIAEMVGDLREGNVISDVDFDSENTMYLATTRGLLRIKDNEHEQLYLTDDIAVSKIAINSKDEVYYILYTQIFKLVDGKGELVAGVREANTASEYLGDDPKKLNFRSVNHIAFDSDDNLIIGGYNGVYVLKNGKISKIHEERANSIATDSKGNIYVQISWPHNIWKFTEISEDTYDKAIVKSGAFD